MRSMLIVGCCSLLALAGCSGTKKAETPTTSSAPTSTTTVELPTTSLPCQPLPLPTTPVTSPSVSQPALLTKVLEQGDRCVDHVIFDFVGKGSEPPGYTVTYGKPPFRTAGSGVRVAVAGKAFVVVKVKPGYSIDFETNTQTYHGPKRVPVTGTNHVRDIVETGDVEGVLTWVIGMDAKRPFSVQATGIPRRQLVVTIS